MLRESPHKGPWSHVRLLKGPAGWDASLDGESGCHPRRYWPLFRHAGGDEEQRLTTALRSR